MAGGGAVVGTVRAGDDDGSEPFPCLDSPVDALMVACAGAATAGCADDHPETRAIQRAVRRTFETTYPTVGSLIDDDFLPYFDLLTSCESGVSHWLSPDYIGDETVLDPDRPESVLVDNRLWRPIGAMFIATADGDPLSQPPAVYGGAADDGTEEQTDQRDDGRCSPWHHHEELPARFAWWYYETVHEESDAEGKPPFPEETPCMMHVWAYPHPDGVYAHGAPPPEYRPGEPADKAGFETDAEPGEDELGWNVLPEAVVQRAKPDGESPDGPMLPLG